jgi:hypothetical protein
MKKFLLGFVLFTLVYSQTIDFDTKHKCEFCKGHTKFGVTNVDIEDGEIFIYEDDKLVVFISKKGELEVDGKQIKTTERERRLLKSYIHSYSEIIYHAKEIGIEGAKVGLQGAALGFKAAGLAIKSIFTGDFEEKVEKMENKLEDRAEELEEHADELEEIADDFLATRCKIKKEIKELRYIETF